MSKRRKKKTETVKSSPLTDKGYSVRIDPGLMGRRYYGRSPLDAALEEEDAALAQELKSTRVEGILLKNRAKVAKLQKEIDKLEKEEGMDSNSSDMPRISVAMAQQIANLPPSERNKVIETYAMFSSIDRSKGKGDSMLPLLIGFSKTNPGTPQVNMLDYAKAMGDQLKTGIDLAKAFTTKEKASSSTEVLKLMKDLIIEGVRNPVLTAIEKSQPQPSAFEQILMNPEMFGRAKEIGMFGSREPRAGSTETDLKIAQITTANTLEMKKMDLEWRKAMLENEAKDRRTDNLMAALAPLSAMFAGPIDRQMRQFAQQQAATHVPQGPMPPQNAILINCSCGYQGPITFQGPPPDRVNCPSCGLELVVGGISDASGNPEKADTGT